MADRIVETQQAVTQSPDGSVRRQAVATTAEVGSNVVVARIINFIVGLLVALLAIRFVLEILGANNENGFASFIYSVTYPFVAPFFGLFGYNATYGVSRFDIESIIAIVVYSLVGYGITKLVTIKRADV
jgi:uncharacterized protein YggT (Ycf19 family)